MRWVVLVLALAATAAFGQAREDDPPVSLRGSPASMEQQHRMALEHDLPFYSTEEEIREAVSRGELVELHGSEVYEVADFVRMPYLHPSVYLFVTRTAALYHEACGEKLVVTSGVRASERQPPNAHALSVHPAGMAVDLRVSQQEACRTWLEGKLLSLEDERVINGIREFRPPHYHVAVFPAQYTAYVGEQFAEEAGIELELASDEEEVAGGRTVEWAVLIAAAMLLFLVVVMLFRHSRREAAAD